MPRCDPDIAPVPFVLGGRLAWSGWARSGPSVLAWMAVAAVIVLPLRGLLVTTGASMEEGFMMVFPDLVAKGKVPNVDFLHLYGPGSLDALAIWFRLFGDSLRSERIFGLLQHLAIITAVYALARVAGRTAAAGAAICAAMFVLTPIGLTALAWHGALGFALWGVVFASRFATVWGPRSLWIGGVLFGLALSFRPDLALAIGAVVVWTVWVSRAPRGTSIAVVVSAGAVGLLPMWRHILVAGFSASWNGMFVDPVIRLRPGRELPRPPSWGHVDGALQAVAESQPPWWGLPAPTASQQLFLWFCAVILLAVIALLVALRRWRSAPPDSTSKNIASVLVAGSLFGLGIVPQALQRPDSTHLAWVAMVSWPLLIPITALELHSFAERRRDAGRGSGSAVEGALGRRGAWFASGAMATVLLVVCPFFTYRTYLLQTRVAVGNLPTPFLIERGDHHFWVGDPAVAVAMAEMIPDLERLSAPGDRLFVGPGDLRKTVYADTYVYWLFDELVPATYYIEMDPGLANAPGSRMPNDIASADFVVLTNTWSGWIEPNTSVDYGSPDSNQVIADEFCLVGSYNTNLVLLFQRCEGGGQLNPADVAGRAPGVGGGGVPSPVLP